LGKTMNPDFSSKKDRDKKNRNLVAFYWRSKGGIHKSGYTLFLAKYLAQNGTIIFLKDKIFGADGEPCPQI
jgi:hypothetical protein